MPESSQQPLYRIDECPDLMVDGHVTDRDNNLVFSSVWGRDTAIQQFIARIALGGGKDGFDHFHLVRGTQTFLTFVDDKRLEKRLTRCYRQTLFGSLVNCWLFDRRCLEPDKANATALALLPRDSAHKVERLWALVKETCPLPLLDHWRDVVLEILQTRNMLTTLPVALGPLAGFRLHMDVPQLTTELGHLIRTDVLTAKPREIQVQIQESLRLAA